MLTDAEFANWLEKNPVDAAHHDDVRLARSCARGDADALSAFEQRCAQVITATAARFGANDFVTEVAQLVRARLFVGPPPRIDDYRGLGSLTKFVQAVTTRVALNQLEAGGKSKPVTSEDALLELSNGADDPELLAIKQRSQVEFNAAFSQAIASLDDEARTALKLHYLDGLTLAELGRLYGWSVPTASRRLAAAREHLLEKTRTVMAQRLALSQTELESVLRLIGSRMSVAALREAE